MLVPIVFSRRSKFARYHANQGLLLLIVEIIVSIIIKAAQIALYPMFATLGGNTDAFMFVIMCFFIPVALVFGALLVTGLTNAENGLYEPLPFIGGIKILR